jgi:hypothetical protein
MNRSFLFFAATIINSCHSAINKQDKDSNQSTSIIQNIKQVDSTRMTGKEFIGKFETLGYFNYTEKNRLKIVADSLKTHFVGDKEFMTAFNKKSPYQSFDLRFYNCADGEDLYKGGAISLIQEMMPLFNKIGIRINYKEDNYINNTHTLVVNGNLYVLAQGNPSPLFWGETFVKFANADDIDHPCPV